MRRHRRVGAACSTLLLLAVTSSCGSGVLVDAYPTTPGSDVDCAALLADLPESVDGLEARDVSEPGDAYAWGDPPVVLRCGVEEPEDFTATSRCATVEDVDWFGETTANGFLFTTVGRRVDVSVDVPGTYQPAADVLVDLADAVKQHSPVEDACV